MVIGMPQVQVREQPTNCVCDRSTRPLRRRNTSIQQTRVTPCNRRRSIWAANCVETAHSSVGCHNFAPTFSYDHARAFFPV
jgi:hypothetical protein